MFEGFLEALKSKEVAVIEDIKGDLSADFVHIKILDRVKDNFGSRKDLIEKQLS
jgi:hypothetical protein